MFVAVQSAYAAQVQGKFYDTTFSTIQKALVTINTTPEEKQVFSENYSFSVTSGSYHINAVAYVSGRRLVAEENFTIAEKHSERSIHRDLIFFPDLDEEYERIAENKSESSDLEGLYKSQSISPLTIIFLALWIVIVIVIVYSFTRIKKQTSEDEDVESETDITKDTVHDELRKLRETISSKSASTQNLKPETQQLYDYIHNNHQVSQRELRKEFPMSDAKLSLVVTELEDKGLIKKIKRGRGNVLIDQHK